RPRRLHGIHWQGRPSGGHPPALPPRLRADTGLCMGRPPVTAATAGDNADAPHVPRRGKQGGRVPGPAGASCPREVDPYAQGPLVIGGGGLLVQPPVRRGIVFPPGSRRALRPAVGPPSLRAGGRRPRNCP